ncbi:hybrid sensor histidine kinase/response regulator [Maridesulfovibrio hydrothermalis]|uniref:Sensory/regulatory protein RpfC n=1 Tax=Maridesulfovibrio hydrothermalis AM13 = DSM 14728 TaxID=1121451 RepID=L0RC67_9BACT|nr:ATP-binding protein [Maridesulfovibrio hydrothermalis]CCO23790.1 PAS/PAC sensor hybrid histidine kinase [Maridesulfovibrio hydrothermalis AM13 = DSM 14728]
MKKTTSYRLSTLVAAAICGIAIVTALALGGVFSYSYVKSLKSEFCDRVKAEGEEYSLEVYSFLHRAMARLGELSRDNSIRVTMMLGVDYPLSEKLAEYDQIPAGIDYFILRKGDDKIFSSSSKAYNETLVRNALESAPFRRSFCPGMGGKFTTIFSVPIRSRSEIVGSAACLVDIAGTGIDASIENTVGGKLILFEEGRAYDLLNGDELTVTFEEDIEAHMVNARLGADLEGVLFKSALVPGLSYFVSNERLDSSLYRTFWLLMPLFVAVIGLSIVLSLFISNKLSKPLRLLTASAEDVSNGLDASLLERDSRLYEINALSNSLSSMLESLRRTKGLEQYQFFFDNVGDLVCITDIDGLFLEVNSRVESHLGYNHAEFLQKTFYELVPAYERQSLRGVLNALFAGSGTESFECPMLTKSGVVVHSEVRARKIEYRGKDVLLSVVRDVTDRKRDEEELQRYASELLNAKEVEERNSAHMSETLKKLEDAMARAEVASRTKSEFLAQMSHEIRTPMNSILGMADMLSETSLTSEQESYVTIFRDSGKALMSLINDILDLSKIESGKLALENTRFDIDKLVDEAAGIMSVSAWKKGLYFACHVAPSTPSLFMGDPTRIKQIIVNLLSNAIKFTASGTVHLEISSSFIEGDRVLINLTVRDTGIGINEDKVKVIFDNFVQADSSTTRKYGGTGLGLSITRNLVELMGGNISVRNLDSGGAEFRAEIVVGKVDDVGPGAAKIRAALLDREIMVIDENPLVRSYICNCLNEWGAKCTHAGDYSFACVQNDNCRSNAELVIVSDKLGEEDGLSEVEAIKARMNISDLKLCTLSTSPGDSSNRPEINKLFGVKGSVRWPVTRGALQRAMIDIYQKDIAEVPSDKDEPELPPLRILVAEDSGNNRMLLDFYLKDTPFRLTYASTGVEAVDFYKRHNFDLVLMDMLMPEKNGYEATREIRMYENSKGYPETPIVALTATIYAEDKENCIDAGCTDYMPKPIKKITLIKTILKYCS